MQLKLQRSQRSGGMLGNKVIFCLDARAELTPEETANVKKYGLSKQVLYNSEASKKFLEATRSHLAMPGATSILKAGINLAMAKLSLNITIESLVHGHHIECKDLEELLGSEESIMEACQGLKNYLAVAATFDGREQVIDFDKQVAAA